MEEDNRYFIKLYIESAKEALEVAAYTVSGGYYGTSVNRSYYAFFYTASALLLTKGLTRNKHIGVLATFQKNFVKEGLIEAKYGKLFRRIFELRNEVDYDLVVRVSEEEARLLLQQTKEFVELIIEHLKREGNL
ncbi:MAG: HEPN domain-containing protein [Anaerolineales bacterium]|nr:HEPN domain-containing protein [Anaerolineales bacterium]